MNQWLSRAARGTTLAIMAEILSRAANTIFFVFLARKVGTGEVEASIYNLSFAYTSFLIQFSLGGLDQLLNREVARDRSQGALVLGNFLFARLFSSLLCYAALFAWITGPAGYDQHVQAVILVLGATLIPDSLVNLIQAYLIAHDRVRYITVLSALAGGLKLGLGALLLFMGSEAFGVAWVVLGTSVMTLVAYLGLVIVRFAWPQLSFARSFWLTQARAQLPLLLIAIMATIEASFDVLLLAQGEDLVAVGVYGTAAAVLNILMLLPQAYRQVILAILAESYATMREHAYAIFRQSNRLLLIISLLIGLSVMLSADAVLPLVFRGRFASESVAVLQILVWAFVLITLMLPHGRLMLVAGHQRWSVPIQFVSMLLNVGLNLLLQPQLGPQGAAAARVASSGLALVLTASYVQLRLYRWRILPTVAAPLGAALVMLALVLGLRWLGLIWVLALAGGWFAYGLALYRLGGISQAELQSLGDLLRRGQARLRLLVKGVS